MAGRGERAAQYRTRSVTPYILGAPGNALKVLNGLPGSGETFCSGPSNPTCTYSVSVMLVPHTSSDQRLSLAPMPTRALTTVYASCCFSTSRFAPLLSSDMYLEPLLKPPCSLFVRPNSSVTEADPDQSGAYGRIGRTPCRIRCGQSVG